MIVRLISGLIGMALFIGLCFCGVWPFTVAVTVASALAAAEFGGAYYSAAARERTLAAPERLRALRVEPLFLLLGTGWPLVAGLHLQQAASKPEGQRILNANAWLMAFVVIALARRVDQAVKTGHVLGSLRLRYGIVGMLYTGMLMSSLVLIRGLPGRLVVAPFGAADRGAWLLLLTAACVWATDTFAYLIGRSYGRRKLAPTVSPNKSFEGALAGLVAAIVAGAALSLWMRLPLPLGLALGALAGVAGQIGDLFESALKRELERKDFGNFMPGHGGILDRFDSLLFVAPLAYLFLRYFAPT